ncbi:MAG: carboxypeptidase-like regulatory domain-containing protein [Acidobacteriota bacterium]|nr:carboxypeptidase-like regulatory domain-containing protein [Acidobacteriota bacterium]
MKPHMKIRKIAVGASIIVTALLCTIAVYAATVVVTPGNLQGWQIVTTPASGSTASVTFVNGPGTPPLGTGSAQLSVGSNGNSSAELRNPNYAGTLLSQITALSYSTYVQQNTDGQAPYIILRVDHDNDPNTPVDLLFFEPVYQNATFGCSNQPTVATNTWQTWDARNGCWYSVNGFAGSGPGASVIPLSTYIAAFPNARIVNTSGGSGGIRIVAGFGAGAWDNFVGNVDAVTIGVSGSDSTTFDFEPAQTTASSVSVSGRIMSGRRGISNARVFLTNQNGETKTALTNSLGYYRFEDVQAGGTYVLNVSSKRYNFQPRVITVNEEMTDVNLTSEQ